jgi:GT2 family glycosyltransferase
MTPLKYAITFACYNQVEYTRQCIESMIRHGLDLTRLVVVDNGSTDNTHHYLEELKLGGRIFNRGNLGCGVAWNQGALALQAEWTIVMNNDVLVSSDWIENLIGTAEKNNLKVISPSLVEGVLDYNFEEFSKIASIKMKNSMRKGAHHAVCLAVHQSVWSEIGYFQPIPKLLGFEDAMFFREVEKAGIPTGMTGASWLHHYGSVTQSAMKQERGLSQKDDLAYRYNHRLLGQSWFERKFKKIQGIQQRKKWCKQELAEYGMTMLGQSGGEKLVWK